MGGHVTLSSIRCLFVLLVVPAVASSATCPDADLGNSVPATFAGSLVGASSGDTCLGSVSERVALSFTAPNAGIYTIDVIDPGTTFPALISLANGSCDGPSLGCSQLDGGGTARVSVVLDGGQTIVALVSSLGGSGDFVLHVDRDGNCPAVDLGNAFPVTYDGATTSAPDAFHYRSGTDCGAKGSEATFRYTAPADGDYVISVDGAEGSGLSGLYFTIDVRDGSSCTSPSLLTYCQFGSYGHLVSLVAGQTIVIVVDAYSDSEIFGPFVLHIRRACAAAPAAGCRAPALPGKARLKIADSPDDAKDKLGWKWMPGMATAFAEWGDPVHGVVDGTDADDYWLCIYDQGSLASKTRIPAGYFRWKEKSYGFTYLDKSLSPDGALSVKLKSGVSGKAQILVKGKGANLHVPPLGAGVSGPVVVQFKEAAGEVCWEATFSPPFDTNVPTRFSARAD